MSVQILASAHHRADTAVTYVQREEEGAGQAAAVEWPVGEARQAGTHEPAEQLLAAPPHVRSCICQQWEKVRRLPTVQHRC